MSYYNSTEAFKKEKNDFYIRNVIPWKQKCEMHNPRDQIIKLFKDAHKTYAINFWIFINIGLLLAYGVF